MQYILDNMKRENYIFPSYFKFLYIILYALNSNPSKRATVYLLKYYILHNYLLFKAYFSVCKKSF